MIKLNPPAWKPPRGYCNGILAEGRVLFVAGQIGWDQDERIVSGDLGAQVKQALLNIVAVLHEGEAKPEHVVRLTWYVTDKQEYIRERKKIGEVYREIFGDHFPPMTLLQVSGLLEEGAKVEIEATAVLPN